MGTGVSAAALHCGSPQSLSLSRNQSIPKNLFPKTAGAPKVACIEAVREIRIRDCLAGARRVNEASAAGVDADVIDRVMPANAEEDQIPRSELGERNRACRTLLRGRSARNRKADSLMDVQSQAAAIEAGRVRSAEVVGRTDQRGGHGCDDSALIGWRRRSRGRRQSWSRRMRGAAHFEQCRSEKRRDPPQDPRRERRAPPVSGVIESGRGAHSPPFGADR
jgi:hypothetical protein